MWEAIIAYLAELFGSAGAAEGAGAAATAADTASAAAGAESLAGGASAAGATAGAAGTAGLLDAALAASPEMAGIYSTTEIPALAGGAMQGAPLAAGGAVANPELSAGGGLLGNVSEFAPGESTTTFYGSGTQPEALGIMRGYAMKGMGGMARMAKMPGMANLGAGLMAGGGQQKPMMPHGPRPQSAPPSGQSNMEILQRGRQQSLSPQEIELLKKLKARGLI